MLVKMKSEAAVKALEFSEGHNLIVNNTPDKLVYTGATVGGVTTGGFHVQKGGTSVKQGDATGRWFVHYRFANEFNGQPWSDIVVYMQLTNQLFAEAKNNTILKKLIVTDETRKFWRTQYDHKEIAEVPNLLSVVSMDKRTAEYLKNWLSGRT